MFADIDAASAAFAEEHKLPGLVAGIVEGGRLVHVTMLGLADREAGRPVGRDTAFRIASMTKNMTALAILSLRDAGKLALDAPLSTYVPQFAAVKPATADSAPVTVRHLLSHVAGFVTDDPWGDRVLGMTPAQLDHVIATGTLFARPPGLAFEYSNLGYALLGRVLTNVSGEPYQDHVRRLFLAPLGLTRTGFDAPAASRGDYAFGYRLDGETWSRERIEPDGEVGAMGGLVTTAPDYASWVAFLLSAWPARDDPETGPVRRASVRELGLFHAPPFQPDGPEPRPSAYGYGLNNTLDPVLGRLLHHAGGLPGYGSHVLLLPERGWGVFAFANRTYAPMSKLTPKLARVLHEARPKPPPAVPSRALRRAVDAVAAAWASGRIEDAASACASNFFLDMPPPLRNAELARLKEQVGEADIETIEPTHALAGRVTLAGARGRLTVSIVLSPERQPGIQKLVLTVEDAKTEGDR
ncbi:serine hydrolase domain-containing protein [Reyranella sp.]|uniref:serine hydrolase domain-containing protein n=1 Tax=Reyranella sp. TaxID=1929291 RepID=UPI003BA961AD